MSDKTILIVDDSLISRMFMRKAVQGSYSHWEVLEANNGHDALSTVEGKDVDIALLDLNMPGGINGLALARSLKDLYTNISIALVTANIQSAVREKASALGVAFIAKPITEDKIVDFLKQCAE